MTTTFHANRPGAWLREDIADILTTLARGRSETYKESLRDVASALGLKEIETVSSTGYQKMPPPIYAVVEVTP